MKDLEEELWKVGVFAKTKHNEVAPAQHELASVYTSANVATDHNQLTMEMMKSVANRHGLVCLLNEKPFISVSGSGKHNNWSISTDMGENLLEPGETPQENAQFLLFLLAVIKAVDEYQDLLRVSVASAGNDHRLGADEAPPAIISIYLGEELEEILTAIEKGAKYNAKKKGELKIGISTLPPIRKDSTDRNRTSPFAFTGNKFEFRMVGSSANIACPNFILNTIVAEELSKFADVLESSKDFNKDLNALLAKTVKQHKRILFSGNSYSSEWKKEAEKRGLLNLKTTVDALPTYALDKNVKVFAKHKVLNKSEIHSRTEILLENYSNIVHIEAMTALDMARKEITPAILKYEKFLLKELKMKKSLGNFNSELEESVLNEISELSAKFARLIKRLSENIEKYDKESSNFEKAKYCKDVLLVDMYDLRTVADAVEIIMGKEYHPYPKYEDILYRVKY